MSAVDLSNSLEVTDFDTHLWLEGRHSRAYRKLGAHPMFQGAGAERLKMCGDCRVIDIHTNPSEVRITDL